MKLSDIKPNIESSGQLEEQFFSIQDQGMIFDILRNKMYSNPILAICREISCNARDAHREVGKPDVPIQIYLPNSLEPFFKVKDFGPGISPDRMSNIFIKYTASTKRADNVQTGGFGLGAKTPFSYSDTFTIKTNFSGVQYNYACFIDETKVGKLALLSESPTSEENGTEIIIPVKPVDFRSFNDWTEASTRHWTVLPIIKGSNVNWQNPKKVIEGKDWFIEAASDYYGHQKNCKLIIDGIEYPVALDALRKYANAVLIDSSKGNLYLTFGVGELSLSASREQVYLDEATQKKISDKLNNVADEIKTKLFSKIDSFQNLWQANIYYRYELSGSFSNIKFLGPLAWKGIPLNDYATSIGCQVFTFSKGGRYYKTPDKIRRRIINSITFDEKQPLYLNDLGVNDITPRHVKKAFDDNPKLETIQVVHPNDTTTISVLNNKIHLDKMEPILLSSITKAFPTKKKPSKARLLVFKFDSGAHNFRQVSYDFYEEDLNTKVLCLLKKEDHSKDARMPILASNKTLSPHLMKKIVTRFKNYSFYGVDSSVDPKRIEEDFEGLKSLDDFINDQYLKTKYSDLVEIKYAKSIHKEHHYDHNAYAIACIENLRKEILPDSAYMKNLEMRLKIKNISKDGSDLVEIYESIKGEIPQTDLVKMAKSSDWDLEKLNKESSKKYPLLQHMNVYSYDHIISDVAKYINLIDKN